MQPAIVPVEILVVATDGLMAVSTNTLSFELRKRLTTGGAYLRHPLTNFVPD